MTSTKIDSCRCLLKKIVVKYYIPLPGNYKGKVKFRSLFFGKKSDRPFSGKSGELRSLSHEGFRLSLFRWNFRNLPSPVSIPPESFGTPIAFPAIRNYITRRIS